MKDWNVIRPVVEEILKQQKYTNSGNYYGEPCFLTPYQIAVLADKQDQSLKGNLPIGGAGHGDDANNNSFAQRIAWHLSKDVNENTFGGRLEIRFLSLKAVDSFVFNGTDTPSVSEVSMFRLI